jgi:endonuclease/exonuclease/phosphatase family metal-dependent hydrolase
MNRKRTFRRVASIAAVTIAACSNPAGSSADSVAPEPASVSVMTFNVQNLFDNVDDPDKDDMAYLPLEAKQNESHKAACGKIEVKSWRDECLYLDWNDAAVAHKLSVLAQTIRQYDDGRGADIIAFAEVENAAILDRLSLDYLDDLGYGPAILIEGGDTRGIDVAFLSRLPQAEAPVLQPMTFEGFAGHQGDTRGVLQATFRLPDGSMLTGFAVHFPAPFHPVIMRVQAYEQLNAMRDALPDDRNVFAAGDFNTTRLENSREGLLDRYVRPQWIVANDQCRDCKGSYYYGRDDSWSFLDMILFSPARGEKTTWRLRAESFRILNGLPAQVTAKGTPWRYDAAKRTGVSDHWPLVAEIELTEKQ